MGIQHLFWYMGKCKNGFQEVHLEDIAKLYSKETGKDPVLLVDASSFLRVFASGKIFTLKLLQRNMEKFINTCFDMGIKTKFIGEGIKPREKYEIWSDRLVQRFHEGELPFLQFILSSLFNTAETVYQTSGKCEFIRSLYEADDYIMRYAKQEGCFAILTSDSDFVIAEGCQYLLAATRLNIETMSTFNYNRKALAESLGLRPSQLPILGSLCVISHHAGIERFLEVAEIIKKCPVQENLDDMLDRITEKMPPEKVEDIKNKFRFYTGSVEDFLPESENESWNDILRAAQKRHMSGVTEKRLLEILVNRVTFIPPQFSSRPQGNLGTVVQRLTPLRRKIYGILFSECPDKDLFVEEYTIVSKGKIPNVLTTKVRFARRSHSGLLQLWSEDRSREKMEERRRLFCETLDKNLSPSILDMLDIPEELLFPVLAVFYLRRLIDGRNFEIVQEVVLTQSILATKDSIRNNNVILGFKTSGEERKMCEPFLTTIEHFHLLNSVCGEPFSEKQASLMNYYDTDLFHFVYQRVVKGKNMPKVLCLDTSIEFNRLREKLEKIEISCERN